MGLIIPACLKPEGRENLFRDPPKGQGEAAVPSGPRKQGTNKTTRIYTQTPKWLG